MTKQELTIKGIPSILWGDKSDKIYIYVHGKMSCKEEAQDFAAIASEKGYQVLSFDLPEHGARKNESYACDVWNGVHDLCLIGEFVKQNWGEVNLFACSLGAYFSLMAYKDYPFDNCLFHSPILDMVQLIQNMMKWFNISEEMLKDKQRIPTPMGEILDWEYYCYVKENPVKQWDAPTAILYGSEDNLTDRYVIDEFVKNYEVELTVMQGSEHYFHTEEQLNFARQWLMKYII